MGEEKTLNRLRERFYWPGHREDVHKWCQQCPQCAQRKTPAPKNKVKLTCIHPGYPLQLVAMDILGPLPESSHKNSYVLVVSDYFTRWTEAYALPNQESATVAHKLVDEFFFRFSLPEQLHSNQGRQFESTVIKEVSSLLQIKKTRTTPYHPQSDGLVERFNRTLLSMLATTIADHPWDWEDNLRQLCYAYNTSVHSSTGYTPFFLMFGRQARIPVDLAFQLPQNTPVYHNPYAIHLQNTLRDSYKQVREKLGHNLQRQKEIYDRKAQGSSYNKGDIVWLFNASVPRGQHKKFHRPWSGPYTVVKQLSDSTYRIQHTQTRSKRSVVHFDHLKQCTGVVQPPTHPRSHPHHPPSDGQHQLSSFTPSPPPQPTEPALHLLDDGDGDPDDGDQQTNSVNTRRYPSQPHRPPSRLTDYVHH